MDLGPGGGDPSYAETAVLHWTVNQRVLQAGPRLRLHYGPSSYGDSVVGRLLISATRQADSGNYSCLPSYATPDWVMVHIVTGQSISNTTIVTRSISYPLIRIISRRETKLFVFVFFAFWDRRYIRKTLSISSLCLHFFFVDLAFCLFKSRQSPTFLISIPDDKLAARVC